MEDYNDWIKKSSWKKNISRNITSIENKTEIQGAPDGDYYIIVYKSEFENKKMPLKRLQLRRMKMEVGSCSQYYIK